MTTNIKETETINKAQKRTRKKSNSSGNGKTSPKKSTSKGGRKTTRGKGRNAKSQSSSKETSLFGIGLFFIVAGAFIFLSILSYLFVAKIDQNLPNTPGMKAANWFGNGGAWTAYYMVERGFGVASFLIAIFLFATGVRIMNLFKVRLWKWFINCGILMLWFSLLQGIEFVHCARRKMRPCALC